MEQNIITATQKKIIGALSDEPYFQRNFYLSGGTALAGFYLHHRYSENLDFFSEKEFDVSSLDVFFKKNKKRLGVMKMDYQQSFNRNLFFLHFPKEVVKTEFTYFPFPQAEKPNTFLKIRVDSLEDIAINKLFTIYQRSTARDYIDLYCIIKETGVTVSELIKRAKIKFDFHIDSLQLGKQFLKANGVTDYPRMIMKIPHKEWRQYFQKEARNLKKDIMKR